MRMTQQSKELIYLICLKNISNCCLKVLHFAKACKNSVFPRILPNISMMSEWSEEEKDYDEDEYEM